MKTERVRGFLGRRAVRVAGAALLLAAALAAAGISLARAEPGHVPPGVVVGGVDVGGRPHDEARSLLAAASRERLAQPILLSSPAGALTVTPESLGAEPEIDEALAEAERRRGPLGRLAARLRIAEPVRIPLEHRADPERLDAAVERVATQVERDPRSATVAVREGEIRVRSARPGRAVRRDELARRLEAVPADTEVPIRALPPAVATAEARRAARRAERLVDDPPAVEFEETTLEVPSVRMLRALRFETDEDEGEIRVALARDPLAGPLRDAFGAYERPPRDAAFVVEGERVRVRSGQRGRRIAVPRTVAALESARPGGTVRARFRVRPPALTTQEARALRIRRLVSEFTTEYACCQPRVTNIQRAAQILDGGIIRPGERYSLNERLGERTPGRGFVPAPMILAGRLVDSVGGGVSQVATTMYNAAFFAGLELLEATPHQFYISRYPMGREATISWGGPELVFRNDWEAGVLVKVQATATAITIRFYSARLGRRVETTTGRPYDYRAPETWTVPNRGLAPGEQRVVQEAGGSGFSVEFTRTVWEGDEVRRRERWTVDYSPQNRIVEVGPPRG